MHVCSWGFIALLLHYHVESIQVYRQYNVSLLLYINFLRLYTSGIHRVKLLAIFATYVLFWYYKSTI